jgi:predicted nuclease of predicted toxin-antitoxin system
MRFLVDQDVYQITVEFLAKEEHDLVRISELGLERASDSFLLGKAKEMRRIFITRDKDFGALVFLEKESIGGVILLRGSPSQIDLIHNELATVLQNYTEGELKECFCVVEPGKHRVRRLKT